MKRPDSNPARVVILGAGFGGLAAAKTLARSGASITLIDKENHHLFQPLLYQVATSGLSAPEIAHPIRAIFARDANVRVLMDSVIDIDLRGREVRGASASYPYDYLVVALGSQTSYFGHPDWELRAPGLKTINDAISLRSRILEAFERAEAESNPAMREILTTVAIVGAGPTGVELAGACAELGRHVLRRDFRNVDPSRIRVVLIEAASRVLPAMPEESSRQALRQIQALGVDVRLQTRVADITASQITLASGETIPAGIIVWAAGVEANPIGRRLAPRTDRSGRVPVGPDLALPDHPEVFVIGDMAAAVQENGLPVPGVAPAAMQMGRHVGRIIRDALRGCTRPRPAFRYIDKGTMATIGRSAAVVAIGPLRFGGFPAWLAWMLVHLIFLVGFRNKISVLLQWAYAYFAYKRGARLIIRKTNADSLPEQAHAPAAELSASR